MKRLFVLFTLLTLGLRGAVWSPSWNPPASYWAPAGVGTKPADGPVVNGIAAGLDPTGSSDNDAVMDSLLLAAGIADNYTVILLGPGTYNFANTINGPAQGGGFFYRHYKIRGTQDENGNWLTNIVTRAGQAMHFGNYVAWVPGYPGTTITGGLTRGSTTLTVANTGALNSFGIIRIYLNLDPQKTWQVYQEPGKFYDYFTARIAGITDSTTLQLEDPIPFTFTATQTASVPLYQNNYGLNQGVGIEKLHIVSGIGSLSNAITFETMYQSWVDECRITSPNQYGVQFFDSSHCEVTNTWIDGPGGSGANHSGVLFNTTSNSKIESTIAVNFFPGIEMNFGSMGCVIGQNFLLGSNTPLFSSHAPNCWANLYEGNYAPYFEADNYFGGVWGDTVFRGWFPAIAMKRFSRYGAIAACLVSYSGASPAEPVQLGDPYIGNNSSLGTANSETSSFWKDTSGGTGRLFHGSMSSVAVDHLSGAFVIDSGDVAAFTQHFNDQITLSGQSQFGWAGQLINCDTLIGNLATLSTAQVALPNVSVSFFLTPSISGYYEKDLAVAATIEAIGVWRFDLNTWYAVIPDGTTFPDSLYRANSIGLHVGAGLTYPWINPSSPGTKFTSPTVTIINPAGSRYYNGRWPDSGTTSKIMTAASVRVTGTLKVP